MGFQSTGPEKTTGQEQTAPYLPAAAASSISFASPGYGVSDIEFRNLPQQDISDLELPGDEDSAVEEGEVSSDVIDRQDQTEDMTYRETVRPVRSFMNHIRVYESDLSEPDKSNNPWKGKNPKKPARISVAIPPDDWPCQKLEKLNTTMAEGYPSRAQDSACLKKDHFNTSYPMDNSLSGRRRPARQTSEKDVLCLHRQVGP